MGVGVALAFSLAGNLFSVGVALLVGLFGGAAGQIGDLAESYLKRSFGVKDPVNKPHSSSLGRSRRLSEMPEGAIVCTVTWPLWSGSPLELMTLALSVTTVSASGRSGE